MSSTKSIRFLAVTMAALALLLTGCPTNTTPPPGVTGDAASGKTVYDNICAFCHSLGSYDTQGFAGDLKGHETQVVNNMGSINTNMAGITLTDQQVADLKAFITSTQ